VGARWSKFVAVALTFCAAALIPTASASALGERDTGGFGAFNLKATNGYSMFVIANSRPGFKHGEILIWLTGKSDFVSYFAPATVTDTRIESDLGSLGSIDLEFQPSGAKGSAAPACQPNDKVPYDKGSYVGEFEFHGEEGYAEATATNVPLSLHPFIDLICGGLGIGETFGHGDPGARLTARARFRDRKVSLQVNQNRPGARVTVQVSIGERRGELLIARQIRTAFSASAFHFDPKLRSASLAAPAPFSGSALFRRGAKPANRWTGDLSVDFPGNSDVSLTGAAFESHLLHARLTETKYRLNRVQRRFASPLRPR
jgi:hypothetical protein